MCDWATEKVCPSADATVECPKSSFECIRSTIDGRCLNHCPEICGAEMKKCEGEEDLSSGCKHPDYCVPENSDC